MKGQQINISREEEGGLLAFVEKRNDPEGLRLQRYLRMPDLSRTEGSPLKELVDKVAATSVLDSFDDIYIPEIVPAHISFDLFNFALDHPARSKSDTYYVDEKNILRTHDTVMWYYYLMHPDVKARIGKNESLGVLCYGKVYRKDEIDRHHMNIFHQMGGLYLTPDTEKMFVLEDLKNVLAEIARSIFGNHVMYRFNVDTFPYTEPSLEMEVEINGKWIEVLGGGMPRKNVLSNFGVEGYNGWAFGFGLERLAIIGMELPDIRLLWSEDPRVKRQLKLGNKFKEVSKYPQITRDISFIVSGSFVPNNYFDLIRDIGGDLVEEVKLLDSYENAEKFGAERKSYTYRIIYRSIDRTLTNEEIDPIQKNVYEQTARVFDAELR